MVILILVLIGLTSCTTVRATIDEVEKNYRDTLISLVPEAPSLPYLPELNWQYEDGKYSLNEDGVDKFITFFEFDYATFRANYDLYVYKVQTVLNNL